MKSCIYSRYNGIGESGEEQYECMRTGYYGETILCDSDMIENCEFVVSDDDVIGLRL